MQEKKSESSIAHIKTKIKVVFLGDQSTGKTSILMRFMHDKFEEGLGATVGIDFMAKNLTVGTHVLRLQLWDTAGQERFRSLIPSYLKDATITFIIFDLTSFICPYVDEKSFDNLTEWFDLCSQNKRQKAIIVLLGNKEDLVEGSRMVSREAAEEKAAQYSVPYFQVSAKNNTNIKEAFSYAGDQFIKQHNSNQLTIPNIDKLHHGYMNRLENNEIFLYGNGNSVISSTIQERNSSAGGKLKKKKGCC